MGDLIRLIEDGWGGGGGGEGGREGNTLSSELTKTNSVLKQKTTDSHCVKSL